MKKTAEEMLKISIEQYNKQVSQVYAFSFNKNETEMFTNLMEAYKDQHTSPLIEALEEAKLPIRSTLLMLMAHPDNELDSEFADRIDGLQVVLNGIETALLNAKGQWED